MDAPLSVVEQRDPKGLYKKARAGEIKGESAFTDCGFLRWSWVVTSWMGGVHHRRMGQSAGMSGTVRYVEPLGPGRGNPFPLSD